MSFQGTPTGYVILWRIGDRQFAARITSVSGYDIATGTWQVGVEYKDMLGQGSLLVSIEHEAGTNHWVLARTQHQRPACNETDAHGALVGDQETPR